MSFQKNLTFCPLPNCKKTIPITSSIMFSPEILKKSPFPPWTSGFCWRIHQWKMPNVWDFWVLAQIYHRHQGSWWVEFWPVWRAAGPHFVSQKTNEISWDIWFFVVSTSKDHKRCSKSSQLPELIVWWASLRNLAPPKRNPLTVCWTDSNYIH